MRKIIIYFSALILMFFVPFLRYYSSIPGVSACVIDYVKNMEKSGYEGILYDIDGIKHIEPKNSPLNMSLQQYKVGEAKGCLMLSNNIFSDLSNTLYCANAYLIQKSPFHEKFKTPLGGN